jgi:hypothetical protein
MIHNEVSRLGHEVRPDCQAFWFPHHPEHPLVITSFKRLIAAFAFVLPALALAASPVMAATQTKAPHHTSTHKTSTHKTHKKSPSTTTS